MCTGASLIEKLHQKYAEYQDNPETASSQAKESCISSAMESLLTGKVACEQFENAAVTSASMGQKTCRLLTWQGRGPQYNRFFLGDLLDSDDLLQRMQEWLDQNYAAGAFRIFNHHIKFSRNSYALVVSWDIDKFDMIGEIIEANRENAKGRREGAQYEGRREGARVPKTVVIRRRQPELEALVDPDEPRVVPTQQPQKPRVSFQRRNLDETPRGRGRGRGSSRQPPLAWNE